MLWLLEINLLRIDNHAPHANYLHVLLPWLLKGRLLWRLVIHVHLRPWVQRHWNRLVHLSHSWFLSRRSQLNVSVSEWTPVLVGAVALRFEELTLHGLVVVEVLKLFLVTLPLLVGLVVVLIEVAVVLLVVSGLVEATSTTVMLVSTSLVVSVVALVLMVVVFLLHILSTSCLDPHLFRNGLNVCNSTYYWLTS